MYLHVMFSTICLQGFDCIFFAKYKLKFWCNGTRTRRWKINSLCFPWEPQEYFNTCNWIFPHNYNEVKENNFIKLKKIIFNKCDLRAIKIKRNGEPENNQMISLNESGKYLELLRIIALPCRTRGLGYHVVGGNLRSLCVSYRINRNNRSLLGRYDLIEFPKVTPLSFFLNPNDHKIANCVVN